jgi:hypothetical protein
MTAASKCARSWSSDTDDAVPASVVTDAVADAHRREWAFVLAATARVARDIDQAGFDGGREAAWCIPRISYLVNPSEKFYSQTTSNSL